MKEMLFEVHNRYRDQKLRYKINYTSKGWHISHISINGDCTPNGSPYFEMNLLHDNITFPVDFGRYLEWLWERVNYKEIHYSEAQVKLQELADWVNVCNDGRPKWKGWNV